MEKARRILLILGIVILIVAIVAGAMWIGYSQPWTGFSDYTSPTGEFNRGKTLWDWLELLIIPIVLAAGGLLFNSAERRAEREVSEQRAKLEREIAERRERVDREIAGHRSREALLQSYLDHMTDLLLDKALCTSEDGAEVRAVARARTLTVLRGLDGTRKGLLLSFLQDCDLIGGEKAVVLLNGADLSEAYLRRVDLGRTNLSRVNLSGAKLREANLSGANLSRANLSGANLIKTDLSTADLRGAYLSTAKLYEADLSQADLSRANLQNAAVSSEQLALAKSLQGATMPDGTKHE